MDRGIRASEAAAPEAAEGPSEDRPARWTDEEEERNLRRAMAMSMTSELAPSRAEDDAMLAAHQSARGPARPPHNTYPQYDEWIRALASPLEAAADEPAPEPPRADEPAHEPPDEDWWT